MKTNTVGRELRGQLNAPVMLTRLQSQISKEEEEERQRLPPFSRHHRMHHRRLDDGSQTRHRQCHQMHRPRRHLPP